MTWRPETADLYANINRLTVEECERMEVPTSLPNQTAVARFVGPIAVEAAQHLVCVVLAWSAQHQEARR